MSDTSTTQQQPAPQAPATTNPVPTAEVEKPAEHMVPISRLNEVIKANKEMTDRLTAIEKASKEAEEKRMVDQQKYAELADLRLKEIETLKPKAAVAEESEKVLKSVLDAQIAEIPESLRGLVPEGLTIPQTLGWIAKNKALLLKPAGFDIGAGNRGGNAPATIELTQEEIAAAKRLGVKPEEYAKYKQ